MAILPFSVAAKITTMNICEIERGKYSLEMRKFFVGSIVIAYSMKNWAALIARKGCEEFYLLNLEWQLFFVSNSDILKTNLNQVLIFN